MNHQKFKRGDLVLNVHCNKLGIVLNSIENDCDLEMQNLAMFKWSRGAEVFLIVLLDNEKYVWAGANENYCLMCAYDSSDDL